MNDILKTTSGLAKGGMGFAVGGVIIERVPGTHTPQVSSAFTRGTKGFRLITTTAGAGMVFKQLKHFKKLKSKKTKKRRYR